MTNLTCAARKRIGARRLLLVLSTILASGAAAPAWAQSSSPHPNLDANGVDLTTGGFNLQLPIASIGAGQSRLELIAYSGQTDNWTGITSRQTSAAGGNNTITVEIGPQFDTFSASDGYVRSIRGTGATLSFNGNEMTYQTLDGTAIVFNDPIGAGNTGMCTWSGATNCTRLPIAMSRRGGMTVSFAWDIYDNCSIPSNPEEEPVCTYSWRLGGVSNTAGYGIAYTYATDTAPRGQNPGPAWYRRTAAGLSGGGSSYSVTYGNPSTNVFTITTPGGKTWRITGSGQVITGVKRPSASADTTSITYSGLTVTSVTKNGVTTSYNYSASGNTATMVVTDAQSHQRTIVSDLVKFRPISDTDALGHTTSYAYDSIGQPIEITSPEGDKTQFGYDGRGNLTSTMRKAKPGSGLADIATTALYPASCVDAACNQPIWTRDAKGNQTDYAYDTATGLVLTVTAPAPTPGAVRPQTRYSYTAVNGVSLLTGISACRTGSSCLGTADETKVTIGYDSKLQPTTVTRAAGDGSLSATATTGYDAFGNVASVDGPLPGTGDMWRFAYDADRRLIASMAPDPDGAGALKAGATRVTYNDDGQPTLAEQGTVPSQASDWSGFVAAQAVQSSYDANARKAKDALVAGGTAQSVAQYSYDSLGRLECSAQRMNPAAWGSLPGDACTLQATGSAGPDRIARAYYNAVGQFTKVTTGYGTAAAADDVTTTYTGNGQVATVADGRGNLTTYEYDGFDRLVRTRYPSPTVIGASSTSDYEELTLDPNGNVTNRRLRDGQTIGYTYDALNRVTLKDVPSGAYSDLDTTYEYDLLGHLTRAVGAGWMINAFGYDALGRLVSDQKYGGTTTYTYDAASRRTRMTWSDGFYVDYDYDVTGNVTRIRENGATSGAGVLAIYLYDDLGRRASITRGNGTTTNYTYDPVSRLSLLSNDLAVPSQDVSFSFAYNPAGQIISRTVSNDAYAWTGAVNVDRPYTINSLNQYGAAGGVSFGYDARGNLTSSGGTTYTYTAENRLATLPANGASLAYEPAGGELLQLYTGDGTDRRFVTSGGQIISERVGSGLVGRYVFGPGADEPLVSYDASGNRSWLIADERGSIIAKTNASGAATAIASYDEYGIPSGGDVGRFGYTGQAYLREIGLNYYKARTYSPTLGRFLQTDPIGYADGMNWYSYVGNDPVNKIDPSGLQDCETGDCGPDIVLTGIKNENSVSLLSPGTPYGQGTQLPDYDNLVGNEPNQDIIVVGQLNGLQTYGNNPRLGRPVFPWYPQGRINSDLPGGLTEAWNDLDRIARLNGITPPSNRGIPQAAANGWLPSVNTKTGYAILTHISGLEIRFNGANLDTRITIPVGLLIAPNTPSTYLPETIHYRGP